MDYLQIIFLIIFVGLSIIIPSYYSYKKRKLLEKALKHWREVTEIEKIRVYLDNINEKFRAKRKWKILIIIKS